MKRKSFAIFWAVFPFVILAQNSEISLPKENVSCNFGIAEDISGTYDHVQCCIKTPISWPDSLVHDDVYFIYSHVYNFEKREVGSGSMKIPIYRYNYQCTWPLTDSGVLDLGSAGKITFKKQDNDFLTLVTLQLGAIQNFELKIWKENGAGVDAEMNNGVLTYITKVRKPTEH